MTGYVDVEEARRLPGLRLVLTEGVPGPWSEAAKAVFHVKGIAFVRVRQEGGGENRALLEWTGQTSAPVAAWNDEPPRTTSLEILHLAERLAPEPRLLPEASEERALVLGTCLEIIGELGLGWCRRLLMFHAIVARTPEGQEPPEAILRMCRKYGYSREAVDAAQKRVIAILAMLARRLERQEAEGRRFLFGSTLGAADLYWATFAALLVPLPHDLCPMPDFLRWMYTSTDPAVAAALDPRLLAHRDRIYRDHLQLPLDF
ncbi:MAG TPA: glutathione S-transferase C-terminal domain-containing protein [Candidatus Binatia bacterium]|nr:glutathione S-transferase C-terminal domain-containing protein [Candidatus Binatia bacterium]